MALKLLMVVRDDLTPGQVAIAAAHASLAAWFKWGDDPLMKTWRGDSFVKVLRKANAQEFERAKTEHPNIVMTESSLGNRETLIVFRMDEEYTKFLNFLPRY